ncbi:uncharacterized protein A4U43_C05F1050 [Asparagus officinalis]|uniref:Xylanase inhibitor C-terminal domain-containing protein n=1 Tax=Asparagus officinalis TaxID=4686 RepID=A0A5P1ENF6_ASPOF|nr:uncharacterized protein A4U43_C05F1050 [Asparagus officinalis]
MNGAPGSGTPSETRHGFYFLGLKRPQLWTATPQHRACGLRPCVRLQRQWGHHRYGASRDPPVGPAYAVLKEVMVAYFDRLKLAPVDGREHGLNSEVCYEMPRRFDSFPSMTFHLRGADLRIEPSALFFVGDFREWFCLMMEPSDDLTIIGAFQQYNTRFTYDLVNRELLFVPEDCSLRG